MILKIGKADHLVKRIANPSYGKADCQSVLRHQPE